MKNKMLFVTAFPPNKQSGGQFFSYNALQDLSQKYDIDLIYYDYPGHTYLEVDGVRVLKVWKSEAKNVLQNPAYFPLFTKRIQGKYVAYLRKIVKNYDVVYLDFSQVALFAKYIQHPHIVMRIHDVMAEKFHQSNPVVAAWAKRSEKQILKYAAEIFVPSEKDAQLLQEHYGYAAKFTHEYVQRHPIPEGDSHGLILFGLWSRKENLEGLVWFLEQVYPSLSTSLQEDIVIMGGGMSKENQEKYLSSTKIRYLGFVEDCYAELVKRNALLVPLFHGAGVKVKVLDCLSTGTPVIGTDLAFEGIEAIPGATTLVSTVQEWIDAIETQKTMTAVEKERIQDTFMASYDSNHLSDLL